jgi:PTS system cellobiose-specific IIA component
VEEQQSLEAIMGLIMYGGNAKSDAMEAIQAAKKGDFELADKKIADAENSLTEAHHSQTNMLTQEAQGKHVAVTLLTVHSQDHLMTAIAVTDLAKEVIDVYRRMAEMASEK